MSVPEESASIAWIRRHPAFAYFALTYALSWAAALAVAAPKLVRHASLNRLDGILMFPAMLVGPPFASLSLTWFLDAFRSCTPAPPPAWAVFSPLAVTALQEALWYAAYAALLWGSIVSVCLVRRLRSNL